MTLKQKREIVKRFFKDYWSIEEIAKHMNPSGNSWSGPVAIEIEHVLRDYCNGKFHLKK